MIHSQEETTRSYKISRKYDSRKYFDSDNDPIRFSRKLNDVIFFQEFFAPRTSMLQYNK